MTAHRLTRVAAIFGFLAVLCLGAAFPNQDVPPQPQGVEVLARGPVHEAFAQPSLTQPLQGPVITKQPPDPIEELPPDERPQGDNVQWIPGYWAWDDDQSDFTWVSGCWRDVPPGRSWMPGHWQQIDTGWIWDAGFWAPANIQEVQYLPPPPPTLDNGPDAPAPDATSCYAPGCWVYRENRYMWRPGHWHAFRPNWVWTPARYVWTPTGCIFVDDYWDYPLDQCGLLFAPCRFDLRVWLGARRPFIPNFVIHTDFLLGALFVNSGNHHYYFGDFFDQRYQKQFVPWVDFHPVRGAFDPNFDYYRRVHAGREGWETSLREIYRGRQNGEIPRPPRTLTEQLTIVKNFTANKTANVNIRKNVNLTNIQSVTALGSLKSFNNTKPTLLGSLGQGKEQKLPTVAHKLQADSAAENTREKEAAIQIQKTANLRKESEAKALVKGGIPVNHTDPPHAIKMALPKPPPHVNPPPAPVNTPPPLVAVPKHEVREIPKYQPPHPPGPPKQEKKDKK